MTSDEAVNAAKAAHAAWDTGRGVWPQLSMEQRIAAITALVDNLKTIRDQIINVLMWEICKNSADAAAEFDRTVLFIEATIAAIRDAEKTSGGYKTVSGIQARVRRAAIGTLLAMGPFNYPFNETYTTIIPALLMGNTVVMKIPAVGGLAHVLTMEAYAASLPAGVMNFVSGAGRETMGPVIKTGVDAFAFIGGSKAADLILREHPRPHRLKSFLSLEGKNLGIVTHDADIDVAVEQCTVGSTTYNGQRCTAIKMIFVHESISSEFITKLAAKISALKAGLPWEAGVSITPLPEPSKPQYLRDLIDDAVSKGASVINAAEGGGVQTGNIIPPAVVAPVTSDCRLWHEEQFGPVVPVAVYKDIAEVEKYVYDMPYGQQAAIFSSNPATVAPLIDLFSTAVGRININTQCGRSPDVFPFSGRRSSALGTLSVTEAINAFSIETVVAFKSIEANESIVKSTEGLSSFMAPIN
jgi:glyceraldehyde-3-phosphate dehydrogenase (NADP+)